MKWLRLYVDVLDDPKVQRLPAPLFKVWVNLLCLTQKHGGHLPSLDDIAFALRMSESDTATALESLTERGLLDCADNGAHRPHNWDGRQYASDNIAERVSRYREKKSQANRKNCNVPCNVTEPLRETPPDTDTEADTETEYISTPQVPLSESRGGAGGRGKRANAAAARGSRLPDGFAPSDDDTAWAGREYPDVDTAAQTDAFCDYWRSKAGKDGVKLDWQATWRNWIRRAAEYSARRQAPTPSRASPLPPRETAFQAARRRNLEIIAEWGAEMDAAIDEQEQRLQEQMAAQSRQEQSNGHDEPTDATPFAARSDGYGIVLSPVAAAPARAGRAGATLERLGYAGTRGFDA